MKRPGKTLLAAVGLTGTLCGLGCGKKEESASADASPSEVQAQAQKRAADQAKMAAQQHGPPGAKP